MTHEERVWHHEMVTNEGIHEHAERIASLEELVLDMMALMVLSEGLSRVKISARDRPTLTVDNLLDRMTELGVTE